MNFEEEEKEIEYVNIEKSKEYKKIRRSLLKQLLDNNVAKDVFEDLVNDYMKLYVVKELLAADIKKNGVHLEGRDARGYISKKNNPSVADFQKINLQMIKLLDKLKLDPIEEEKEEADMYEL